MYGTMRKLVVFDDHKCGDHGIEGKVVQEGMDNSPLSFLGFSVRRLEDEDGLGEDQYSGGVEKRVSREETERRMEEDTGPDKRHEKYEAALGEDSRPCVKVLEGLTCHLVEYPEFLTDDKIEG
jgi:hypothetical protein